MSIESQEDLDGITLAGRVVAGVLKAMESAVETGISTRELDEIGASVLRRNGARSAPQIQYGCPAHNLISVNDEIVHGLPGPRTLRPGDVVKLDVTAEVGGYIADAATTVVLPGGSESSERLRGCAIAAFEAGCAAASAGRRVSAIGRAVEREVVSRGFSVLRELSGEPAPSGAGQRIELGGRVLAVRSGAGDRESAALRAHAQLLAHAQVACAQDQREIMGLAGGALRELGIDDARHLEATPLLGLEPRQHGVDLGAECVGDLLDDSHRGTQCATFFRAS